MAIDRLRNHLIATAPISIRPPRPDEVADPGSPEEEAILNRFFPFAELMYLVARADGVIVPREREAILGAYRTLTGGRVPKERLRQLEDATDELYRRDGLEERLERICTTLALDRGDAELALSLAAAVALADCLQESDEVDLLQTVARWLGLEDLLARAILNRTQFPAEPADAP